MMSRIDELPVTGDIALKSEPGPTGYPRTEEASDGNACLPVVVQAKLVAYSRSLKFWLNGRAVEIVDPDPSTRLVDYLRDSGLTGTKVGCGEGGCGACTVMISRRTAGQDDHRALNACLRPLAAVADCHVTTVEGIGNIQDGLDPVQDRIARCNGSQCGFCTPGFVMNAHAYLRNRPSPSQQEMEDLFGGNLCRCTGYRPILHAMRTFARDYDPAADPSPHCEADPSLTVAGRTTPSALKLDDLPDTTSMQPGLYFQRGPLHWFRPPTMATAQELNRLLGNHFGARRVRLVVGNTARAIYPHEDVRCLIDVSRIPVLTVAETNATGLLVGAAVSIQRLMELAEDAIAVEPAERTVGLRELTRHAKFLAGVQVRSAGSVGGNIAITKSHTRDGEPFPSDLFTILATLGATVTVASAEWEGQTRCVEIDELPPLEDLPGDAMFVQFQIPWTDPNEHVRTFRVARRLQMAHPIVNAGFRCRIDANGRAVPGSAFVVFGGLASCNRRMPAIERALAGRLWNAETLEEVLPVLEDEVNAVTIPMEGEGFTTEYRRSLALGFFYKFFVHMARHVRPHEVAPADQCAADMNERALSKGQQHFLIDETLSAITRPIVKQAGFAQASGEIRYPSDESLPTHGVHGVLLLSQRAHARFEFTPPLDQLESELRARFPGFEGFVTAADIPGRRLIGLGGDDPIFFEGEVTCVSAPMALVVATTVAVAEEVAEFVGSECVIYEDLPAILTLDEAIAQHSLITPPAGFPSHPEKDRHVLVTRAGSDAAWLDHPGTLNGPEGTTTIHGQLQTGAQVHFYMEPGCALAIPGPYGRMTIHSSTQNPNGDQTQIARVLGVKANHITICLEQIGGGFGGKQNRAVFIGAMAAVAARKLRRPVRVGYDRSTDTQVIGKRHPYLGSYDVAFSDDGTLHSMKLDYCSEGGNTVDASFAVLKGSCMMSDGCYGIATFQAGGNVYRTNKTSNTAFRTFGQIQPHLIQEEAIERVAFELSRRTGRRVLPEEIRRKNLYRSADFSDADSTHFGQPLWFCKLREQWDRVYAESQFDERLAGVDEFNRTHRWKKRGIAMTPLKYGIGFKQLAAMNTASAIVQLNKDDGSITVIHGGVEMGQGLHTKIAQVVAGELNVPLDLVRVTGNCTDAINNAPPTAASTGFDLNGGAVAQACRVLRSRIEQFCAENEEKLRSVGVADWRVDWQRSWPTLVAQAWLARVSLISAETYQAPHYEKPVEKFPAGKFFAYFAYGFSVSEVEIDVLTGESTVLRADLYYDAGRSSNPAIDIGQIEGGYVQGLGFVTTEEVLFDAHGRLVTDNIWTYKPPCTKTIPLDFRVTMLEHDPESREAQERAKLLAVSATKSAAEPTLSLGVSAYFAIKRAVRAARLEQTGRDEWLRMDVPASCQVIQTHCGVAVDHLNL
jgi:xanthine dehydrogenase/oxidase